MNNKPKRKQWSKDEIELVTKLYEEDGLSITELYPIFNQTYPNRTLTAVKVKITKQLKLRHTKEQTKRIKSENMSGENNPQYGKPGLFKGETKETNEIIKKRSKKVSETRKKLYANGTLQKPKGKLNPMYGKKSWCNGLTKYTSKKLYNAGLKISQIQKEKWKKLSQIEKDKRIQHLTKYSLKARKDTKIEMIIKDHLDTNNIEYIKNYRVNNFFLDFYIPKYNLVIECQGDYWHANKKYFKKLNEIQLNNKKRDKKKKNFLIKNNYKILFFWENYIHKNKDNMFEIISKYFYD